MERLMKDTQRERGSWIGGSNVPGNPLRSYRMSMLSHGFVDTPEDEAFDLDEADPVAYSVVRLRSEPLTTLAYVVLAVLIIAAIALIVFVT